MSQKKIQSNRRKTKSEESIKYESKIKNLSARSDYSTYKIPHLKAGQDKSIEQTEFTEENENVLFNTQSDNPATIILLLDSPEIEIIKRTLHYFYNRIEFYQDYAKKLYNLKIIDKILEKNFLKELSAPDIIACLGLILAICQLNENQINEGNDVKPKFEHNVLHQLYDISKNFILTNNEDTVLQYSTGIISKILDEPRFKLEYENDNLFLKRTFDILTFSENEITIYHCYQMIKNILPTLTNIKPFYNFPFVNAIHMISNSETMKLQEIAFTTLADIITTINDEKIIMEITESTFLNEIINVLENSEKPESHPKILEALKSLMKIEAIAKYFFGDNLLQNFFNFYDLENNFIPICNILCELCAYSQAHQNLFQFGLIDLLFDALDKYLFDCGSDICLGISRMYKYRKAYAIIVERNPILKLLKILSDNNREWEVRETAADTIYCLVSRSFILAESLVKNFFELVVMSILSQPFGTVTPECILKVVDIINVIYQYENLRELVMTDSLAVGLLDTIQNSYRSAEILSSLINCLSIYICEKKLQDIILLYKNYPEILLRCLRSPATIVKSAVTILILLSGRMKTFADFYIEHSILEKLINDQYSLSTCETWSPAIDAILRMNPSIKFCVRGRLDFIDKIGHDFYASKRQWKDYRILCHILADEVSPLYPILIVNYDYIFCQAASMVKIQPKSNDIGDGDASRKSEKNFSNRSKESIWSYCRRPSDENLPKYLYMLKNALESRGLSENYANKDYIDITKIEERAKLVAEIVFNEMCGDRPGKQTEICSEISVANHLNQIKYKLHCNIIPLGKIRFGGQFERALLFKSLADKIGLPSTLVRNIDGKILYCELPVPTYNKAYCRIQDIPIKDLIPTHIIDLMDSPGALYPINSPEAFQYLNLV